MTKDEVQYLSKIPLRESCEEEKQLRGHDCKGQTKTRAESF